MFTRIKKIDFWFSRRAIHKLANLKYVIDEERNSDYKDFFWACFSSIIRKASKADPFIPPPVLLKTDKYKNSPKKHGFLVKFFEQSKNPNVIALFKARIEKNFERMKAFNKVNEIQENKVKSRVIWDDAQNIKIGKLENKGKLTKEGAKALPSNSIDLILTSPPYLTAQKYIRTQRLELLWLGISEIEVARLEKEIIGSERVSLKETDFTEQVGVKSVNTLVKWALLKSTQRAAMVNNYFLKMKKSLSETHRVLREGAYAIVVVGNNMVLGKGVRTHELLIDVAKSVGFELKLVLKDRIRGRGMITKRHNTGGLIREEFSIIFKKSK
ncbi:MAG: hypothetical protein IBV52_05710 [Candidatus Bathyarchaeota archaeon]